jgi:hypothetical protein
MFRSAKANALNAAQIEGDDIVVEQEPSREESRVPVSLSEIYRRLDLELRLRDYSALLAELRDRPSPLAEPEFDVFKAELRHGGKVEQIDLVKLARHWGVIGDTESPVERWSSFPVPTQ